MNVYAVSALIMALSLVLMVIKQIKSEYSVAASVVVCIILASLALSALYPLIDYITSLSLFDTQSEYFKIVMKSTGVALLCSLASEICKDTGENALSYGVELFCKCEIVAMSLPLITGILDLASKALK